jgi:transposase
MNHIDRSDLERLPSKYLTKFQRQLLKKQLEIETVSEYRQRIEIMLLADDGRTQTQICRALSCSPLTARHWIFMAKSGQAHNWQTQPMGRPKTVTADYLDRLRELVSTNPKDLGYPFSRWTGQWLSKHLSQEFNIGVSARHINRLIEDFNIGASARNLNRSIENIDAESRSATGVEIESTQAVRSRHLVITDLYDRQNHPE